MTFWIVTGLLTLGVAALLALALIRGRRGEEHPAAYDLRVYRDQMKEVDRDLARGVIAPEDAERIRAEVARRLLLADTQLKTTFAEATQPRLPSLAVAGLSTVALLAGSFLLYQEIGAPGYGDLGLQTRIAKAEALRENRPSQAQAEAGMGQNTHRPEIAQDYTELMDRLRAMLAERPADLQGQTLLARNEAALGNFRDAYAAQMVVLRLKGPEATAQDYVDLADMKILAAGGYVSPEAEEALRAALARDPANGAALYYMGLMAAQTARPDQAFRVWDQLLRRGPADAPWIPPILAQIEEMSIRAGVAYVIPDTIPTSAEGLAGPTALDIEAAGQMSPMERMVMIESMVTTLSQRLTNEGGTPEEWAQLITALGVMGNQDGAYAVWVESQQVFGADPAAMDRLRAAAERAGVE